MQNINTRHVGFRSKFGTIKVLNKMPDDIPVLERKRLRVDKLLK